MILKRSFQPRKVVTYVWRELILAVAFGTLVFVANVLMGIKEVTLPFGVLSLLGAALAIFLAFRNSASFARWGEAAQLWSGIANQCRILARLAVTFVDSHAHSPGYKPDAAAAFKKDLAYRLMAWPHALRGQLRDTPVEDDLRPLLTLADYVAVNQAHSKPNVVSLLLGRQIYQGMAAGILQGFDSFQMEGALAQLSNLQAGCERIKSIPLPRQYDYFTRMFVRVK